MKFIMSFTQDFSFPNNWLHLNFKDDDNPDFRGGGKILARPRYLLAIRSWITFELMMGPGNC